MKKIIFTLLVLSICFPVFAAQKKHQLEIAYESSDYGYREPHMEYPIHITSKKQGVSVVYTCNGVFSSFNPLEEDHSFASIEFRYMDGKADYDGYLMDGTEFKTYDEKDYYMEAALKIGRSYQLANPLELRPYIGIGWRSLRNGEDGYQDYGGVTGYAYQRTSTYVYIPLGGSLVWHAGDVFSLSLNGQFDWLIHGNQSSHTGDMFINADSVSNKQDKGYGVRASVKAEVDMGPFGIFVEPFWRYWKIQNSQKVWYEGMDIYGNPYEGYIVEPFNITREYGIRAGITF